MISALVRPAVRAKKVVLVERQALALVPGAPGLPVDAHVVHDRPVHVEDQGLDRLAHARAPLSRFGRCSRGRAGANRSGGGSATRRRPERSTAGTKALVKGRSALGPPRGRRDLQEVAAAVVRHGHHRAEREPVGRLDGEADEVGEQELVFLLRRWQLLARNEQADAVQGLRRLAGRDALDPGDEEVGLVARGGTDVR